MTPSARPFGQRKNSLRWPKALAFVFVAFILALPLAGGSFARDQSGCKEFLEYGLPSQSDKLLCRTGFALAHDEARKIPLWVAQRMTTERLEVKVKRSDRFTPDPELPKGKRAELEDYSGSGYDRGHMAPAADMRWSEQAMRESFYLSNMAPQIGPGMNRGIWSDIEAAIRGWVKVRGELFIFTGPIFERSDNAIGPNKVAVPTHFYKIAFDPVRIEAIAFVVPNAPHPNRRIDEFITSVRDIENRTGLDFLNRINPAVQSLVEEAVAQALW